MLSEIKSALPQKFPQVSGSWWPHLTCCSKLAVPIPEHWAHLVLSREGCAMQPRQTVPSATEEMEWEKASADPHKGFNWREGQQVGRKA